MDDAEEVRLGRKRAFGEFLEQDHGQGDYPARIKAALSRCSPSPALQVMQVFAQTSATTCLLLCRANIDSGRLRLHVDMHDLREHSPELLRDLLQAPSECLGPFEEALGEFVRDKFPKTLLDSQQVSVHAAICALCTALVRQQLATTPA